MRRSCGLNVSWKRWIVDVGYSEADPPKNVSSSDLLILKSAFCCLAPFLSTATPRHRQWMRHQSTSLNSKCSALHSIRFSITLMSKNLTTSPGHPEARSKNRRETGSLRLQTVLSAPPNAGPERAQSHEDALAHMAFFSAAVSVTLQTQKRKTTPHTINETSIVGTSWNSEKKRRPGVPRAHKLQGPTQTSSLPPPR